MSQRLNKDRYRIADSGWYERHVIDGVIVPKGVTYDVADLHDIRLGHDWRDGAHKVALDKETREVTGMRSRTFYGESAWSDAARYVDDVREKLRHEADRQRHGEVYR